MITPLDYTRQNHHDVHEAGYGLDGKSFYGTNHSLEDTVSYDASHIFEDTTAYVSSYVLEDTVSYNAGNKSRHPKPRDAKAATSPVIKPLRELNLTNSFMFAKVMSEPEVLKEFLQLVLGFRISHIEMAEYEKALLTKIDAKNIRLDIYAGDGTGRKYCVEMQAYVEYNIGRRSRYYQSAIDIDSLTKGQRYKDLGDTIVIFICTYDPFRLGQQKYVFQSRCVNSSTELALGDGVSTIVLTDCDGDPAINDFFRYAKNSTDEEAAHCDNKLIQLVHERVQRVRFNPALEVEYMRFEELQQERYDEGYNLGIEQGVEQGSKSKMAAMIKNMLESSEPDDKICRYANCTPEILSEIKKEIGQNI